MVKHIAFLKFKEFAEGRTKKDNLQMLVKEFKELKEKIPEIKEIEFGINNSIYDKEFDAALYTVFADYEDLESYMNNPIHVEISQRIAQMREKRLIVDYEM